MKIRWLAWAVLLAILPLVHAACGEPEPVYVNGVNIACNDDCDCYTDSTHLLGTQCTDGICQCPVQFTWMYKFPCCEKGRALEGCPRMCMNLDECEPSEIDPQYLPPGTVWPPADGGGGAGGASSSSPSGG